MNNIYTPQTRSRQQIAEEVEPVVETFSLAPSSFPIERGVPIPPSARGRRIYPFAKMHVGDSFFVPFSRGAKARVYQAKYLFEKKHPGYKFLMVTQQAQKGFRLWLVTKPMIGRS
jgi:hypothetical protein